MLTTSSKINENKEVEENRITLLIPDWEIIFLQKQWVCKKTLTK